MYKCRGLALPLAMADKEVRLHPGFGLSALINLARGGSRAEDAAHRLVQQLVARLVGWGLTRGRLLQAEDAVDGRLHLGGYVVVFFGPLDRLGGTLARVRVQGQAVEALRILEEVALQLRGARLARRPGLAVRASPARLAPALAAQRQLRRGVDAQLLLDLEPLVVIGRRLAQAHLHLELELNRGPELRLGRELSRARLRATPYLRFSTRLELRHQQLLLRLHVLCKFRYRVTFLWGAARPARHPSSPHLIPLTRCRLGLLLAQPIQRRLLLVYDHTVDHHKLGRSGLALKWKSKRAYDKHGRSIIRPASYFRTYHALHYQEVRVLVHHRIKFT
jgi:hypothetical protein